VTALTIALAGAIGAVARFAVDGWVRGRLARRFPWGIVAVNVSGSLLLGLLAGLGVHAGLPAWPVTVLGAGFCGSYTTFSTLSWETVRLAEERARLLAVGNALGSLVAGVAAATAGIALAMLLGR
jgi:fluoride exporter